MINRFFERSFTFALLAFTLPLLFLPKINLIGFGGRETAGIRIDDVILFLFIILFFWAHCQLGRRLRDIEKWLFAIVGFSILSYLFNQFLYETGYIHVSGNLLYALRIVEYFSFFYIGLMSVEFIKPSAYIKAFILWNCSIMFLQKAGLVGEFSMYGYNPSATYRPPGICSFPSEAGVVLNMLFCYLIFQPSVPQTKVPFWPPYIRQAIKASYLYIVFLIFALLTAITGSRIAIAAIAAVFLYLIRKKMSWRTPWSIGIGGTILLIGTVLVSLFVYENKELLERSKGLLSMKNVELVETVWSSIDTSREPSFETGLDSGNTDMSWWIRIRKWIYVLKIYVDHPLTYVLGVGPGVAFAGLDGGYLRILVENGLLGVFLYWNLFKCIAKKSPQLMAMVSVFAINMIFFDVYLAYKPMSLLFLVSGMTWAQESEPAFSVPTSSRPVSVRGESIA